VAIEIRGKPDYGRDPVRLGGKELKKAPSHRRPEAEKE